MNDKCSAKKAAIPNFFPTIFITGCFFTNQSLLLLVSKLDYCQRYMSFGYIIDGMTIPDNQA